MEIKGPSLVTASGLASYMAHTCPDAPARQAVYIYAIAEAFGLRAEVVLAQQMHETGYYKYGGTDPVYSADASYNNFCGLKTTDSSATARFGTPLEGVIAHVVHLAWYCLPYHVNSVCSTIFDPRHFSGSLGGHRNNVNTVEELGGKWAPSLLYGAKIRDKTLKILDYEEVRKYA